MADAEHGLGAESTESMVGSNVVAQPEDASLADKGEEKREDYGSTGDNEQRSDSA